MTPRRYQLQTKSEANLSKMSTLTPTSTIDAKTSTHIAPKLQPGTENLETNNIFGSIRCDNINAGNEHATQTFERYCQCLSI
jgi:hypothetical protein